MFLKYPELSAQSYIYYLSWATVFIKSFKVYKNQLIYMSLKNSTSLRQDSGQHRIRVNKKKQSAMLNDQGGKKSMSIAEAFEHEKAMAQNYRQKNERNILKCRFLFNKLTTLGSLEGVPQMIASQISEVDAKIKELDQTLNSKKALQMKKLRKKVSNFLQRINFEVQAEDMDKLEDEIELILFLIDVFEQKFNQMTAQRKEVDDIINRLQRENQSDLNIDFGEVKKQNQRLLNKLLKMENQMQKMKNEYHAPKDYINQITQEDLDGKNLQIQRHIKRIQDLQAELNELKSRFRILQVDLERSKKEQLKLKERYRVMEIQKNERIKLLQQTFIKHN